MSSSEGYTDPALVLIPAIMKRLEPIHLQMILLEAQREGALAQLKRLSVLIPGRDSCVTCKGTGGNHSMELSQWTTCLACAGRTTSQWLDLLGLRGLARELSNQAPR